MWKRIGKFTIVAILGFLLVAPAMSFAHSADVFSPVRGTAPGWKNGEMVNSRMMGTGMMGMGGGTMGMGTGMMDMMHGMAGMGQGMMMGADVPLTEEQQKKFVDIQNRFLKESVKPRTELIRAHAALQSLLSDPAAIDEAIEEQVQKAATAQARLFVLRIRTERETDKLYTKEQREHVTRGFSYGQMGMIRPDERANPCAPSTSQKQKNSF